MPVTRMLRNDTSFQSNVTHYRLSSVKYYPVYLAHKVPASVSETLETDLERVPFFFFSNY